MTFPLYDAYDAISVTVPNDGANHQLFALMQAIDPSISPRAKYLIIQNDPGSADKIKIGSAATDSQGNVNPSALSATNYGFLLTVGSDRILQGVGEEYFNITRFFLRTSGVGTAQLNIQVIRG